MTGFEEYKPIHVTGQIALLTLFLTKDFTLEYMRGRLTEIYDRELVDRLMPFKKEDYFELGKMETINDDELVDHGFYVHENAEKLFNLDENFYHIRK
jgi:hypothetical protein